MAKRLLPPRHRHPPGGAPARVVELADTADSNPLPLERVFKSRPGYALNVGTATGRSRGSVRTPGPPTVGAWLTPGPRIAPACSSLAADSPVAWTPGGAGRCVWWWRPVSPSTLGARGRRVRRRRNEGARRRTERTESSARVTSTSRLASPFAFSVAALPGAGFAGPVFAADDRRVFDTCDCVGAAAAANVSRRRLCWWPCR